MEAQDEFLHRFMVEEEIVFDNEAALDVPNENPFPMEQLLNTFGGLLDNADQTLEDLSSNDNMLGTAIVRGCQELANAVGHIATELEQQSDNERRTLANACLQDVHENRLQIEDEQTTILASSTEWIPLASSSEASLATAPSPQMRQLATMSTEDIMSALSGASTLLRDVEVGLRGIEQDEADEIADMALTLARLFVASLQSFQYNMVQKESEKRQVESDRFELIEDEEEDGTKTSKRTSSRDFCMKNQQERLDRLRVLWPPLGPAVVSACAWGTDEATRQPILAVALGMTLWPAAVATAFFGAPLVIVDSLVQHTYSSFQEGPIVSSVEKSAAQLVQAGKLSLMCGKIVGRQSLRVINRQIERNGGVGPIAENLARMALDKALHPVETVSAVWGGIQWAWAAMQENLRHLNDQERQDANAATDGWQ